MNWDVPRAHAAHLVAAVRSGIPRRQTVVRAVGATALLLIGTLVAVAATWSVSGSASEWATPPAATTEGGPEDAADAGEPPEPTTAPTIEQDTIAAPTTEDAREGPLRPPESTATLPPSPAPGSDVTLTATAACAPDGGYAGRLTVVVTDVPATITDVRALFASGATMPVGLTAALPVTLARDTAPWQWWLVEQGEETSALVPTALLVRVDGVPGDAVANQAAGDAAGGWLLAALTIPETTCPRPTPSRDATVVSAPQGEEATATEPASAPTATLTPDAASVPPEPGSAPTATATPGTPPDAIATAPPTVLPLVTPPVTTAIEALASSEAAGAAAPDPITITARSSAGEALPGASTSYWFRITNTTADPITVRLSTTNSLAGWMATIYAADGTTELPTEVRVAGGTSITVIVRVTAPGAARSGDQNVTTFDAQPIAATSAWVDSAGRRGRPRRPGARR